MTKIKLAAVVEELEYNGFVMRMFVHGTYILATHFVNHIDDLLAQWLQEEPIEGIKATRLNPHSQVLFELTSEGMRREDIDRLLEMIQAARTVWLVHGGQVWLEEHE